MESHFVLHIYANVLEDRKKLSGELVFDIQLIYEIRDCLFQYISAGNLPLFTQM